MLRLERLVDEIGTEIGVDLQDLGELGLGFVGGPTPRQAGGEDHPGDEVAAPDGNRIPGMGDRLLVLPEEVVGGAGDGVKDPGPYPDGIQLETGRKGLESGFRISRVDVSVAGFSTCTAIRTRMSISAQGSA